MHFLPRDAMLSVVYAVVVCPSFCLCVCRSHSGIVSKQLNVGLRKERHAIAPSFPMGATNAGGVGKKSPLWTKNVAQCITRKRYKIDA